MDVELIPGQVQGVIEPGGPAQAGRNLADVAAVYESKEHFVDAAIADGKIILKRSYTATIQNA